MNHCSLTKDKAAAPVLWAALICFQKRALMAYLYFMSACLPASVLSSFPFSLPSSFLSSALFSSPKLQTWKAMQVRQPWYGKLFCFSKKTRPLWKFLDFLALLFGSAIWLIPWPGIEPGPQQWTPRILTTRELLSLHFNTTSHIDVFTCLLLVSNFMTLYFL